MIQVDSLRKPFNGGRHWNLLVELTNLHLEKKYLYVMHIIIGIASCT